MPRKKLSAEQRAEQRAEEQRDVQRAAEAAEVVRRNSTVAQFVGAKRKAWMVDGSSGNPTDSAALNGAPKATRTSPRKKRRAAANSASTTSDSAPSANALPSPAETATDGPSPQETKSALELAPANDNHSLPPTESGSRSDTMNVPGAVASGQAPRGHAAQIGDYSGTRRMQNTSIFSSTGYEHLRRTARPPMQTNQQNVQHQTQGAASINNYVYQRPNAAQQQNKRRKADNNSQPSLTMYLPLLENYEMQHNIAKAGSFPEKRRFGFLKDAVLHDDYFYVGLHQIFSLWHRERNILNKIAKLGQNPSLADQGLQKMTAMLVDILAAPINVEHARWFATFPGEFDTLMNFSDAYKLAVHQVVNTLIHIVQNMPAFLSTCIQRRYPPMADELTGHFACESPVMLKILFMWVRNQMQIKDGNPLADLLFTAFTDNLKYHDELTKRINTNFPPTQRELDEVRNYAISQYQTLISTHGVQSAQAAPVPSSVPIPGQPNGPGGPGPSPQMQNVQQALQAQSQPQRPPLPTPEERRRWQQHAQQFQQQQLWRQQQMPANSRTALANAVSQSEAQLQQQQQQFYQNQEYARRVHMEYQQAQARQQGHPGAAPSPVTTPGIQGQPLQQRLNLNGDRASSLNAVGRASHSPSPALQSPAIQNSATHSPIIQQLQNGVPRPASAMSSHSTGPGTAISPIDVTGGENTRRGSTVTMPSPTVNQQQFTGHGHMSAPVTRQKSLSLPQGQPGKKQHPQIPGPVRINSLNASDATNAQRVEYERRMQSATPTVPSNGPVPMPPLQSPIPGQPLGGYFQPPPQQYQPHFALQRPPLHPRQQQQAIAHYPQGIMPSPSPMPGQMAPGPQGAYSYAMMAPGHQLPQFRLPPGVPYGLPFVPPANIRRPQMAAPNPDLNCAHLAHLRDAALKPIDRVPEEKGTVKDRYYQSVKRCVAGPVVIAAKGINRFNTFLTLEDVANIPPAKKLRPTDPDLWEVKQGSLMYRVKTIKLLKTQSDVTEEEFMTTDLVWPANHMNFIVDVPKAPVPLKNLLDFRKKPKFDKDLPLDLTTITRDYYSKEENKGQPMEVSAILGSAAPKHLVDRFAFAVEEVQILRHQQIVDMVTSPDSLIPRSVTEAEIKKKLNGKDEDDDICMVATDLHINLQDPWLAKLWTVPVKGAACLHGECFDLSTFLETRPRCRRERSALFVDEDTDSAVVSAVDVWKCPLCGGDARPEKLRVVEWMVDVRKRLVEEGKADDVKGIVVSPDGSWKVAELEKEKERSVTRGESAAAATQAAAVATAAAVKEKEKVIEIIDLDDD